MRTKLVYISGGDKFAPPQIKAALDEIRRELDLADDVILFGMPVGEEAPAVSVLPEPAVEALKPKVLKFPRKSILSVIANPAISAPLAPEIEPIAQEAFPESDFENEPATLTDAPLIVSEDDSDHASITALFDKLPSMSEDEPPKKPARSLADDFSDFLDKDEAEVEKRPKPFARRRNLFANVLGDLFSYAGIAANDDAEEFKMPDFIKRP